MATKTKVYPSNVPLGGHKYDVEVTVVQGSREFTDRSLYVEEAEVIDRLAELEQSIRNRWLGAEAEARFERAKAAWVTENIAEKANG